MAGTVNEKLILLVQKYPCLYDPGDKDYKNILKKHCVWNKIAKEIQHNREATKIKWKNLKDGYTKYWNQTNGVSQKKTYVNWIWGPSLHFLDCLKKTKPNTETNDTSDDYVVTEDVLNSPARSSTSESALIAAFIEEDSQDASTNQSSSKKRKADTQDAVIDYLRSLKRNDRDAVDHLFASYAETFKKLKPRTQASLKPKLAQIFAEAEINDLDFEQSAPLMSPKYPVDSHSQITSENDVIVKEEEFI